MPNLRLIINVDEDFVLGEPQRSEMLFYQEGAWREDQECSSLEGRFPPVSILGMCGGFMQRL